MAATDYGINLRTQISGIPAPCATIFTEQKGQSLRYQKDSPCFVQIFSKPAKYFMDLEKRKIEILIICYFLNYFSLIPQFEPFIPN